MAIPHQQHGAMTGFTPQQGGRPMYMAPRMMQMQQYHQQQQQVSRRKSLIDKKKMKKVRSVCECVYVCQCACACVCLYVYVHVCMCVHNRVSFRRGRGGAFAPTLAIILTLLFITLSL